MNTISKLGTFYFYYRCSLLNLVPTYIIILYTIIIYYIITVSLYVILTLYVIKYF